ncbi:TrmB family transcriptional regulator [Paenibacillus marinisediminis]
MNDLIRQLRSIGFTEMEAKIMITLSEQGMMTGYEVAKKLGVSRSNVYAALQRLVDHGYVLVTQGDPTHYKALDARQLTAMMSERMQQSLKYVESHMPVGLRDEGGFFSIEGEKSVLETFKRSLSQAETEIIVDAAPQDAAIVQDELRLAEGRGVKVLWSLSNEEGEARRAEALMPDIYAGIAPAAHRFVVIIDRRKTLIGMRGDGSYTKALMTDHPAVTELVLSHFIQDIILYELEQVMDDKMRDNVGPHFSKLIDPYLGA